jgi:hypothetical protein
MGKKKFIDKKVAKTYALVYESTDAVPDEATTSPRHSQRVLHEYSKHSRQQELPEDELRKFREKQGHPLEWLMEERGLIDKKNTLDEKKRHELIELGFDDDGYDYMQHLKTLEGTKGESQQLREIQRVGGSDGEHKNSDAETGREKLIISQKKILFDTPGAHLEREKKNESDREQAPQDGGVFVKAMKESVAEDDVAFFDASQLTVMQQVSTEDDATGMMGGVTAFAKRSETVKERRNYEISELERMMEDAERSTDEHGRVLGDGDLLDDFILTATEMQRELDDDVGGVHSDDEDTCSNASLEWFSDGGVSSVTDEVDGQSGHPDAHTQARKVPGPGSIASTYWREERQDRRNLLSAIDERFEHLALEYDEDELGDMEELADDIQGGADVEDFENILDEFIRDHPRRGDAKDMSSKLFLAEEMEKHGFGNEYAALSIQMAKESIRRASEISEGDDSKPAANEHIEIDRRRFEKDENKWDCESILSLRSNIYNHPGTITEPSSKPPKTIKLGKHGLPVGYAPSREFVSTKSIYGDDLVAAKPATGPNVRKKGESAEEKKSRKAAVKAAKRESRATKKEMKVMFAQERSKASKRDARMQPNGISM